MAGEDIWKEYKRTKSETLRNQLVMSYLWLVKYMAGRLAVRLPSFMGQEDLESCGVFGLLEAVEKFDPDLGIDFETYAYRRIRGSMIDEIRKANWLPRTMWQKLQDLKTTKDRLEREEKLSEDNLAGEMGLTVQELRKLEAYYHRAFAVSLDENLSGSESSGVKLGDLVQDPESPDPFDMVVEEEDKIILAETIKSLQEKEQLLLALYYQEGLTLKEIGLVLEVSESRVCQLHGRTISRLRKLLAEKYS
ncbi:MAG: FliA/WhiG family RNA polymerase sigma factor [Desulfocucumaceae bacterium]